jgi:hypothetical protein
MKLAQTQRWQQPTPLSTRTTLQLGFMLTLFEANGGAYPESKIPPCANDA